VIRKTLREALRNDEGISPVIGTILMVAATVIIGGAVYAAVNAYSGKTPAPTTDAGFKASTVDTDADGLEDTIKVTYLNGPRDVASSLVALSLKDAAGTALTSGASSHSNSTAWNAGDYQTYKIAATGTPGTVYVTVAMQGSTILDQTISLRE
jgi:flagellin-like protein